MLIVHNELISVETSDIVNDTVIIPNTVKTISPFAFTNCDVKYLSIPNSVTEICDSAFLSCESLEEVILPKDLKKIRNAVFQNCINLKSVRMSDNITEIMQLSFANCSSLREINFSKKIKKIGFSAFYKCNYLDNIILPESLEQIDQMAFQECSSLKKLNMPINLKEIGNFAFLYCSNLENVNVNKKCQIIHDGVFDLCEKLNLNFESSLFSYFDINNVSSINILNENIYNYNLDCLKKIQKEELISNIYEKLFENNYTYNLDKNSFTENANNYTNFSNLLDYIINRVNSCNDIDIPYVLNKVCVLYPQTRFINFPDLDVFLNLNVDLCSKYNHRIYKKLLENGIFESVNKKIIIDLIGIFGLFNNDQYVYKRLEILEKILNRQVIINESDYEVLDNEFKKYFKNIKMEEYNIKENIKIPSEFSLYLKRRMDKNDVKLINKINKRLGKQIKSFFTQNYIPKIINKYELVDNNTNIKKFIYNSKFDGTFNKYNLENMFLNSSKKYNPKSLNFIVENIDYIINNSYVQGYVKNIIDRYDEIKKYYLQMGNNDINIIDMVNYLSSYVFLNTNDENIEFSLLAKNAGVTNQEHFEEYQRLYEKMKIKRKSSIPRIVETFKLGNYKVGIEILRLSDPLGLFVGEKRYTNNCLKLGDLGEECLRHAVSEGRTLCIYLYNENNDKTMLAESWIWRNGNLICFDNIEGTNLLKKNEKYQSLVFSAYKIITELLVQYMNNNNDYIGAVTVGKGQSDIDLTRYGLGAASDLYLYPKNYEGYTDSKLGYFLYGNMSKVDIKTLEPVMYADERVVICESGKSIKTSTLNTIKKIKTEISSDNQINDLNNLSVVLGDDWYLLYDDTKIVEFNMSSVTFEEEYQMRDEEIEKVVLELKSKGIILGINDYYLENIYNQKKKTKNRN